MQISPIDAKQAVLVAPINKNAITRIPSGQHPEADEEINSSGEHILRMVGDMQNYIKRMNIRLEFSTYGDKGEKIAVTVADKETGEVIREIPPKEIRDLYIKMSEVAGIIFNREV